MAKTVSFSKYQREARRPDFVIELDDGTTIAIPSPDGETIMDAEESGSTRRFLSIMCGEQWDDVEPLVSDLDGEGLRQFAQDMTRHFGLDGNSVPEGKRRKSSS